MIHLVNDFKIFSQMFGIFLYMEKWYIGYFQLIHKNKQKSQEQIKGYSCIIPNVLKKAVNLLHIYKQ